MKISFLNVSIIMDLIKVEMRPTIPSTSEISKIINEAEFRDAEAEREKSAKISSDVINIVEKHLRLLASGAIKYDRVSGTLADQSTKYDYAMKCDIPAELGKIVTYKEIITIKDHFQKHNYTVNIRVISEYYMNESTGYFAVIAWNN
jgi:hypothetical protein